MIECVFTIDYELYGNGHGQLEDLVYEPARRLQALFNRAGARFVNFVEAVEFQQIERCGTDGALPRVRRQIEELYQQGHEIGLHLHPQWADARFEHGHWHLNVAEYNLCVLPRERITRIVDDALAWLRGAAGEPDFTPLSFRAGNWLFQPTRNAASVLASRGIAIDSSVFAGGVQRRHGLDYRSARRNGWHWWFSDDVNVPEPDGVLLELPIYTEMVPFWRMLTGKRVGLQQKTQAARSSAALPSAPRRSPGDFRDYLRPRYPMKFDFCRMTLGELTALVERVLHEDALTPRVFKPLVAVGHTKDLVDLHTVEAFLNWLKARSIVISTLSEIYGRYLV